MGNALSERDMLDLLRARYKQTNPGNGPRYALAEHVKNAAGFDANRQADLIAMDLWPGSGGVQLIGHEVKCSRADWLTELKDPSKAEAFKRYMHRWYLVAADAQVFRVEEVPRDWGIIVRTANGTLRAVRAAPRLQPDPLPYGVLAPLLRAANLTGSAMGIASIAHHIPARPCRSGCLHEVALRTDGKWWHPDTKTTRCRFPENDYRNGYRAANAWRAS